MYSFSAKPELSSPAAAQKYYDGLYRTGRYMDEWNADKKTRVHRILANLHRAMGETGVVVDFGCGTGEFTPVLAGALPGWTVVGAELSDVAVAAARARLPDLWFDTVSEIVSSGQKFDLVFTHHVLEHVADLESTWREMGGLLKPTGFMVHILPCGNAGSFEHAIASMRPDGVQRKAGNRFFFEDPSHLRRLTTDDLVQLAAATGLRLEFEAYANQHYGAIRWITEDPRNALRLTNTKGIRDKAQTRRLTRLRLELLSVSAARFAASGLAVIRSFRLGNRLNLAKAAVATLSGPLLPLCCLVDSRVRARAEAEWKQRAGDRGGSEMYLAFGPAK